MAEICFCKICKLHGQYSWQSCACHFSLFMGEGPGAFTGPAFVIDDIVELPGNKFALFAMLQSVTMLHSITRICTPNVMHGTLPIKVKCLHVVQ